MKMIKLLNLVTLSFDTILISLCSIFEAQNYSKSGRTKENELLELKKSATEHKSDSQNLSNLKCHRIV